MKRLWIILLCGIFFCTASFGAVDSSITTIDTSEQTPADTTTIHATEQTEVTLVDTTTIHAIEQTEVTIIDTTNISESETDTLLLDVSTAEIPVQAGITQPHSRRYIIVSAVAMMLFVGLCMGTVSSFNPK